MTTAVGVICILGGIALLGFGLHLSRSLSSKVTQFFTGKPSAKSVLLILGGVVLIVFGLAAFLATP